MIFENALGVPISSTVVSGGIERIMKFNVFLYRLAFDQLLLHLLNLASIILNFRKEREFCSLDKRINRIK